MKLPAHLLALVLAGSALAVGCGGEVEGPTPDEETVPTKESVPGTPAVAPTGPNATQPNSTPTTPAAADAGSAEDAAAEETHTPTDPCPACGMG